jgi:outer membrane protein assembly factor BamB
MQRRHVLAAVCGAGTAGVAGCLGEECPPRTDAEPPPEGWPMPGFDAANTGLDADGDPPSDDPTERWRFDAWEHGNHEGAVSAPVVDDERVYVTYGLSAPDDRFPPEQDDEGTVFALEEATGELEWEHPLSDPSGAPALVGDGLVVGDGDGTLARLERRGGDVVWETDLGAAVRTPAVADGWCYVQTDDGRVFAVDVETGEQCWDDRQEGFRDRLGLGDEYRATGRPAVTDDTVVVLTGSYDDSTPWAVLVRGLDRESGSERWAIELENRVWSGTFPSPAVADGTVYVAVPGELQARSVEDGNREWTFATGVDATSSPTVGEDAVYLGAKNVYAVDRDTGEERWRHVNLAPDDDESSSGTDRTTITGAPVVVGDRVLVGFGALDRERGDHRWGEVGDDEESDFFDGSGFGRELPTDGQAVANGALYATTRWGRLAKLGGDDAS